MTHLRNLGGALVALAGFLMALAEFGLRWQANLLHQHYDLSLWPILFGSVLIFVGGFIINSKKAEAAGGFVVNSGVRIIGVLRTGNRASDPVVTITKEVPARGRTAEMPPSPPIHPDADAVGDEPHVPRAGGPS